mmetsp:Transcript_2839/g.9214  ORF Transcript_2839/g.9214 Transcript_2839/m.9214 type:complete len:265 (-) Transcript_2839:209-1003(-)
MNSLRSSSSSVAPPPPTSTCLMTGSVSFAMRPTTDASTGTSLHPSTASPSASIAAFKISIDFAACFVSWGRNTMPTPEDPSANPSIPFSAAYFSKSFHGTFVMIPAPSPESSSALHAPRCSMHPSAVSASWTVLCVRSPLSDAMNPTPHASDSSRSCSLSTTPPAYGGRPGAIAAVTTAFARGDAAGAESRRLRNLGSAADFLSPMNDGIDVARAPTARRDADAATRVGAFVARARFWRVATVGRVASAAEAVARASAPAILSA